MGDLPYNLISAAEIGVRHGEIRIQLDGVAKQRNGATLIASAEF